jgi:hypothetical protein
MPVLAVFASQIATRTGDAEPEMAGDEMIKRSFFNRTDVDDGRSTIDKCI